MDKKEKKNAKQVFGLLKPVPSNVFFEEFGYGHMAWAEGPSGAVALAWVPRDTFTKQMPEFLESHAQHGESNSIAFFGYVRQLEFLESSQNCHAILMDAHGNQTYNIRTENSRTQSVIETAFSAKLRVRGSMSEKSGLIEKIEINLADQHDELLHK
jgi:hypothetical protein